MKLGIILCILIFASCQFWVGIEGKKNQKKKKSPAEQKEILNEITTDLEICIQSDKNVDKKERMFVHFSNCLTNIKKQKKFLGKKDKSPKKIFKKVLKKMIKCMIKQKKKSMKKIKKNKKKRKGFKKNRIKRGNCCSHKPEKAEEDDEPVELDEPPDKGKSHSSEK